MQIVNPCIVGGTESVRGFPTGEVGKGKRADVYLEVRKRRGHIFFE
jgi:hypothetical protein